MRSTGNWSSALALTDEPVDLLLGLEVEDAERARLRPFGPVDPIAVLEGTSEEAAAYQQLAEIDRTIASAHMDRCRTVAYAYVKAMAAGRQREDVVAELMGTGAVSRQSAEYALRESLLFAAHPRTVRAVYAGAGLPQAKALVHVLSGLSADVADAVEAAVLPRLVGRPPSRIREIARREALRRDPESAARRRREASQNRAPRLTDLGDGMVELGVVMRAEQGLEVLRRAEHATDRPDGTGRTRDQRAADWMTAQLLGADGADERSPEPVDSAPSTPASALLPGAALALDGRRRRPLEALVHVPVTTALDLDDEPCTLERIGPVDAGLGRLLLSSAQLRKVCVDETTGEVLQVEDAVVRPTPDGARVERLREQGLTGEQALAQAQAEAVRRALVAMVTTPSVQPLVPEPQYRPSAALSRTVKARRSTCDFPGCSAPSRRCDDEHTVAHPRGSTSAANLAPRSRWCHQRKQRGWTPSPLPDGGTLWTSPSGRVYTEPPDHEPPPPVPAGVRLPPPVPPPPRDDAGRPEPLWTECSGQEPDELTAARAWLEDELLRRGDGPPPAAPAARGWPDDAPF